MYQPDIILIGGGGHAGVVLDACRAAGRRVVGVYDDDRGCAVCRADDGVPWMGPLDDARSIRDAAWIVALGDLARRRAVIDRIENAAGGCGAADAVVHPSAALGSGVRLGVGAVVMAGCVVQRGVSIGAHAIVNTGAVVEHDCVVGDNTHVAPGSVLGGGVRVGPGTLVGIRAGVIPGVRIGDGCVVGAGASVIGDLEDGVTAVGVPARALSRQD